MQLQRISVVMPLDGPAASVGSVAPVSRRWSRERWSQRLSAKGARGDRAADGSGVVLAGFDGDLVVEEGDQGPVLRYTLKSAEDGEPAQHIVLALGRLLEAAGRLERASGVRVDRSSVTVQIADRLNAPNTDEVRQRLQAEVVSAVTSTLGFATPDIIGGSVDPRDPLSWTLRGLAAPSMAA